MNAGWSLGAEDWEPFDIRGTFNGNGRTLDLGSRTRLFYIIGGAGVVTGVGLLNVSADRGTFAYANFGEISRSYSTGSVTQDFAFAGGIAGNNYGVIRESHTTASVRVSGKGSRVVGGLAGQNLYGGLVTHSCAHGDVWLDPAGYEGGSWPTGGLVGNNDGYVVYGCATGDVRGYTQVGGLVGLGDASHSYATGDVTGADTVGGLLGAGYASHSYATGSVNGNGYNTGGLAGAFSGVQGSYATGDVTGAIAGIGSSGAGGLVGNTFGNKIVAAYSTGNVLNATLVGGLAGSSGGQVLGSYSISRVFRGGHVGGLLGSIGEDAVASASYWNRDIYDTGIGLGSSEGVIGLTTAEMQSPTGYTGVYADWNTDLDNADLDNDPATGRDDYWDFGSGSRYPALKADMDGDGVATAAEFGVQHPGEDRRPPATPAPTEPAPNGRYDADGDRLIEISNLEQLDAMRHDGHALNPEAIDGDGVPWGDEAGAAYSRAFPTGEGESGLHRGLPRLRTGPFPGLPGRGQPRLRRREPRVDFGRRLAAPRERFRRRLRGQRVQHIQPVHQPPGGRLRRVVPHRIVRDPAGRRPGGRGRQRRIRRGRTGWESVRAQARHQPQPGQRQRVRQSQHGRAGWVRFRRRRQHQRHPLHRERVFLGR